MWKWMGLFLSKNHLLRYWCWLSPLNWIGALIIISVAQTSSKKVGALIRSMTFLSPGAALYLYKSTIRPYCCHIWAGTPSCYLELLEKLQKRIYRTIGPSVATSLELLAHRWNVARLSLSIGINLVNVLPYSRGRSSRYPTLGWNGLRENQNKENEICSAFKSCLFWNVGMDTSDFNFARK